MTHASTLFALDDVNRALWSKSATYHDLMRKADLRNMKQPDLSYYGSQGMPREDDEGFKLPEISGRSPVLDEDAVSWSVTSDLCVG